MDFRVFQVLEFNILGLKSLYFDVLKKIFFWQTHANSCWILAPFLSEAVESAWGQKSYVDKNRIPCKNRITILWRRRADSILGYFLGTFGNLTELLGGFGRPFLGPFLKPFLIQFTCFRLLLPVPILWRGRADSNVRTLSKLHLPQPNVDVLPPSLPVHKTRWQKLCRGETGRPMLPNHHVSRR